MDNKRLLCTYYLHVRRLVSTSTLMVAIATVSVNASTQTVATATVLTVATATVLTVATATVSVDVDTKRRVDTNGCYNASQSTKLVAVSMSVKTFQI